MQKVIQEIQQHFGDALVAIYQVGLSDNSALSDIDLVIVLKDEYGHAKFSSSLGKIDVRAVMGRTEFAQNKIYFPYARISLVSGTEVPAEREIPEIHGATVDLIKLSSLFFKGFFRNLYQYRGVRNKQKEILTHLNDFSYLKEWMTEIPESLNSFCEKITLTRALYPSVGSEEVQRLLEEGIDHAWQLAGILNEDLKNKIANYYPRLLFTGIQPTLFTPTDATTCRRYTERLIRRHPRLKLAYLPIGFSFVAAQAQPEEADEDQKFLSFYIRKFVEVNLQPKNEGFGSFCKSLIKLAYAGYAALRYYWGDIYEMFDMKEAYGVRQARVAYGANGSLSPAEEQIFSSLSLPKDASILDAACGGGRTTYKLFDQGYVNVRAFDNQEQLIAQAKEAARSKNEKDSFQVADLRSVKRAYSGHQFDLILLSFNGLDYIYPKEQRLRTLRDLYDLLKPNGKLMLSGHNPLCITRANLKILSANCLNLANSKDFLVTNHSYGHLLTHYATPQKAIAELKEAGFHYEATIPNQLMFFPLRDPFPYYVAVKK